MQDPRCCGTGTCIINDEGVCWCGQRWDGERMSFAACAPTHSDAQDDHDASPLQAPSSAPAPD